MSFVSDIFGGDTPDNSAQVRSVNSSLALQKQMYDDSVERTQPFYDAGVSGLNTMLDKLGLSSNTTADGYGSLLQNFSQDQFTESPNYQYNLDESTKAAERALASKGQFTSMNPAAAKAVMSNASNLASNEYQNAYNNYNNDQNNVFNRLASMMGYGQTANTQMNTSGTNYANTASDLYQTQGNLSAAQNNAESAWNRSMWGDIGSAAGTALSIFSDRRVKENIIKVGEKNGFNIYEFNYIWSPKRWRGVIAQEVEEMRPDAVITDATGLKKVNYAALGLSMEAVDGD